MRLAAVLVATTVLLPAASFAADYPSPTPYVQEAPPAPDFNWGGLYGGIHAGYSSTNVTGSSVATAKALSLATGALGVGTPYDSITFDKSVTYSSETGNAGAFVGSNWVFDDVVVGVEADWISYWGQNQASRTYTSPPVLIPFGSVTGTGTQSLSVNNIGLFKLRAGFPVGRFLPFATIGLALGQGSQRTSFYTTSELTGGIVSSATYHKQGWLGGGTAGVGVDYAVLDNVFLRAEYNYIAFSGFNGSNVTIHNVQAGIAIKY
jgi:outer membrane immunogenic protein